LVLQPWHAAWLGFRPIYQLRLIGIDVEIAHSVRNAVRQQAIDIVGLFGQEAPARQGCTAHFMCELRGLSGGGRFSFGRHPLPHVLRSGAVHGELGAIGIQRERSGKLQVAFFEQSQLFTHATHG
jgi:hypothetical protein